MYLSAGENLAPDKPWMEPLPVRVLGPFVSGTATIDAHAPRGIRTPHRQPWAYDPENFYWVTRMPQKRTNTVWSLSMIQAACALDAGESHRVDPFIADLMQHMGARRPWPLLELPSDVACSRALGVREKGCLGCIAPGVLDSKCVRPAPRLFLTKQAAESEQAQNVEMEVDDPSNEENAQAAKRGLEDSQHETEPASKRPRMDEPEVEATSPELRCSQRGAMRTATEMAADRNVLENDFSAVHPEAVSGHESIMDVALAEGTVQSPGSTGTGSGNTDVMSDIIETATYTAETIAGTELPPKLEEFVPKEFLPGILNVNDTGGCASGNQGRENAGELSNGLEESRILVYKRHLPGKKVKPDEKEMSSAGLRLAPQGLHGTGSHSSVYRAALSLPAPLTTNGRSSDKTVTVIAKTAYDVPEDRDHLSD